MKTVHFGCWYRHNKIDVHLYNTLQVKVYAWVWVWVRVRQNKSVTPDFRSEVNFWLFTVQRTPLIFFQFLKNFLEVAKVI